MTIENIIEAYKKMKGKKEEKLSPEQEREMDVDDDGDIDGKDLKKLRKKKHKKDDGDKEETSESVESEEGEELSEADMSKYRKDLVQNMDRIKTCLKDPSMKNYNCKYISRTMEDKADELEDSLKYKKENEQRMKRENQVQTATYESVDFETESKSGIAKAYMEMREKQAGAATPPEKIDSKMSGKNKDFVNMHKVQVMDRTKVSVEDSLAAGRATSVAPKRPADK